MSTFAEMKLPEQTFVPLGKLVIIKPFFIEKTKKGVYLPDGDKFKGDATEVLESIRALVVAVGTTCKYVRRGDVILLYPHKQPVAIKHGGNELLYATDELSVVGIESRMGDCHAERLPVGEFEVSHPDDSLKHAMQRVMAGTMHDQ